MTTEEFAGLEFGDVIEWNHTDQPKNRYIFLCFPEEGLTWAAPRCISGLSLEVTSCSNSPHRWKKVRAFRRNTK